jgi:geranylgeranyl reductase
MNPWQQIKLTLLTIGAILRGNALAPEGYRPVPSAVRPADEAEMIMAEGGIRGGIRVAPVPTDREPALTRS